MKALILNNKVVQTEDQEFPVASPLRWIDCTEDVQVGYTLEGTTFSPPEVTLPTIEQLTEAVRNALQGEIDRQAQMLGFSSGNALMLYAGKDNPFRALADPFFSWEASVWYQAEVYKQQVLAGLAPMLSPQEAIAMMPPLTL
jgi:hypothetical protein